AAEHTGNQENANPRAQFALEGPVRLDRQVALRGRCGVIAVDDEVDARHHIGAAGFDPFCHRGPGLRRSRQGEIGSLLALRWLRIERFVHVGCELGQIHREQIVAGSDRRARRTWRHGVDVGRSLVPADGFVPRLEPELPKADVDGFPHAALAWTFGGRRRTPAPIRFRGAAFGIARLARFTLLCFEGLPKTLQLQNERRTLWPEFRRTRVVAPAWRGDVVAFFRVSHDDILSAVTARRAGLLLVTSPCGVAGGRVAAGPAAHSSVAPA